MGLKSLGLVGGFNNLSEFMYAVLRKFMMQ